jgi:hypothetical protein
MFQIKWENKAVQEHTEILKYWIEHNQSEIYSPKLYAEIKRIETLLEKNPNIGSDTDFRGIKRIVVLSNFSLFYYISENVVYILSFWDNRRNTSVLVIK